MVRADRMVTYSIATTHPHSLLPVLLAHHIRTTQHASNTFFPAQNLLRPPSTRPATRLAPLVLPTLSILLPALLHSAHSQRPHRTDQTSTHRTLLLLLPTARLSKDPRAALLTRPLSLLLMLNALHFLDNPLTLRLVPRLPPNPLLTHPLLHFQPVLGGLLAGALCSGGEGAGVYLLFCGLGADSVFDALPAGEVRAAGYLVHVDVAADGVGEEARAAHVEVGSVGGVVAGVLLLPVAAHGG